MKWHETKINVTKLNFTCWHVTGQVVSCGSCFTLWQKMNRNYYSSWAISRHLVNVLSVYTCTGACPGTCSV